MMFLVPLGFFPENVTIRPVVYPSSELLFQTLI